MRFPTMRWWAVSAMVMIGAGPVRSRADLLVGPEFQANSYTTANQGSASVARAPTGDFVVVWQSPQDGSFSGIFGQRYNNNGAPLGAEFPVNLLTTDHQFTPVVATDAAGNFMVAWSSYAQDPDEGGIAARRFDSAGNPLGADFQVNTYTTSVQYLPSIAENVGGFAVVWWSYGQDGDGFGIFGRNYDSNGAPGTEIQVNTYTTGDQYTTSAAISGGAFGNYIVVWDSPQDGSGTGVIGRRWVGGGPFGPEFPVNTYTTGFQDEATVAVDYGANSNFVVVWRSDAQDGDGSGVFARRFDNNATPLGGEFQVNEYTTGSQSAPAVAFDQGAGGGFTIAWADNGRDGNGAGIFARHFDSTGNATGPEFQVNTYTTGSQNGPRLSARGNGDVVVTWGSQDQDGSNRGVFAQRVRVGGRYVLGKACSVKNPASGKRKVDCQGKEKLSGEPIPPSPLVDGATLRLRVEGTTTSDQSFILPASFWKASGATGWKYADRKGLNGPVSKAAVKLSGSGTFQLKAKIKGTSTTPTPGVQIVPPNSSTAVAMVLEIVGSQAYCVGFGSGQGGGTVTKDDANVFKVKNATAEGTCLP